MNILQSCIRYTQSGMCADVGFCPSMINIDVSRTFKSCLLHCTLPNTLSCSCYTSPTISIPNPEIILTAVTCHHSPHVIEEPVQTSTHPPKAPIIQNL